MSTRSKNALFIISFALVCWLTLWLLAQPSADAQQTPAKPGAQASDQSAVKPETVVQQWFERWNALDGTEDKTKSFLDLYEANAIHQVGPSARQIGPVFLEAPEGIRKMAEEFAKANTDILFKIERVGIHFGASADRIYVMPEGPRGEWGAGVAVPFVGAYTVRETKKRFMYPGAAFFEIRNGKIHSDRFYTARDELVEVSAP